MPHWRDLYIWFLVYLSILSFIVMMNIDIEIYCNTDITYRGNISFSTKDTILLLHRLKMTNNLLWSPVLFRLHLWLNNIFYTNHHNDLNFQYSAICLLDKIFLGTQYSGSTCWICIEVHEQQTYSHIWWCNVSVLFRGSGSFVSEEAIFRTRILHFQKIIDCFIDPY